MRGFAALLSVLVVSGFLLLMLLASVSLGLHTRMSAYHADARSHLRAVALACAESLEIMVRTYSSPIIEAIRIGDDACAVQEITGSSERKFELHVSKGNIEVVYQAVVDELSTMSVMEITEQ